MLALRMYDLSYSVNAQNIESFELVNFLLL